MKAFAEELEARLSAMTVEDLRQLVRDMAQEVTPPGRRPFLQRLHPRGSTACHKRKMSQIQGGVAVLSRLEPPFPTWLCRGLPRRGT
ncbi:MAG: hypothetical protein JO015_10955 [Verrucomicrobia bacterium]|nr:hypothetical protein [Verrucomicrobiota bacterium]